MLLLQQLAHTPSADFAPLKIFVCSYGTHCKKVPVTSLSVVVHPWNVIQKIQDLFPCPLHLHGLVTGWPTDSPGRDGVSALSLGRPCTLRLPFLVSCYPEVNKPGLMEEK